MPSCSTGFCVASTKNGIGQLVVRPAHRHPPLLHRLQHGRLRLGRRAVDLVGQNDVGEDRALEKLELPLAGRRVLVDHLRAGDVAGHQVRGELDALERKVQGLRQRGDQQRLGQPRHADQQRMAAGEDGDQHLVDHLRLADDHLRQFALERDVAAVEILDLLEIIPLGCFSRRSGV